MNLEKMTDQERRIRCAELMGWTTARCEYEFDLPDPDHSLDDAVKLAEACGSYWMLSNHQTGKIYNATVRKGYLGKAAIESSPARALTSAVLKAMEATVPQSLEVKDE